MATAVNPLKEVTMKRGRLRQSLVYLIIGLVVFAFINVSWAAGVEVEVPYAVTNAQWWTGVAIKNLNASSATANLKMEFFDSGGDLMGAVDIAPLEPLAIYSQATSNIYLDPLPESYSIKVSHPGNQKLTVTVFVGNSATGGFAYQTYTSQACCLPSWHQILPIAERFELVMSNEAVLDRETGLVWQREASDTTYDWYDAKYYCYNTNIGGRGGWRLPSVEELRTLIDPTESYPALPEGHLFTNTNLQFTYWSSTTYTSNTLYAWRVYFGNGNVFGTKKSYNYYVRAVRSGQ